MKKLLGVVGIIAACWIAVLLAGYAIVHAINGLLDLYES